MDERATYARKHFGDSMVDGAEKRRAMMIRFWRGELYPVYNEDRTNIAGNKGEIDEALWKKYLKARETFMEILDEVEESLG